MINIIYWIPENNNLNYKGTTIEYNNINSVLFQNNISPDEKLICSWSTHQKSFNDLPNLKPGHTYFLEHDTEYTENIYPFIKINFYNKNNELIKEISENSATIEFKTPFDFYSYTIDLYSAGIGSILFHNMIIYDENFGISDPNCVISKNKYVDGEFLVTAYFPSKNLSNPKFKIPKSYPLKVIFIEPNNNDITFPLELINNSDYPVLLITDLRPASGFFISPNDSKKRYEKELTELIQNVKKNSKAKSMDFIGYGPISSFAASLYGAKFKKANIYVSHLTNSVNEYIQHYSNNHFNSYLSAFKDLTLPDLANKRILIESKNGFNNLLPVSQNFQNDAYKLDALDFQFNSLEPTKPKKRFFKLKN